MKYVIGAVLIAASLSVNSQQVFHDPEAQERKVAPFNAVEVSSAIELQLSQGSDDAVAVSAGNKENLDMVKTDVNNGVLRIWVDQKGWLKNSHGHIRAYVSAKSLTGLRASGASTVTVNGIINTNSLALEMSGASDFKGEVKASSLNVHISGASDAKISGSTTDLKVEASGASHLKGFDFVADNCLINASGASDVELTANKVISAHASGASNVYYKGSGQEGKISSSGASSISRKG